MDLLARLYQLPAPIAGPVHTIFLSLLGVLVLASLAGWWLARRHPGPVATNFNARVRSWWFMILLMRAVLVFGRAGVVVFFLLVSFLTLREFLTLAPTRKGDHRAVVASFFLGIPLQYLLVWWNWYGLYAIFLPVYAFLTLPILALWQQDTHNFLARTAETQWGLMICVYCLSYIPALANLEIPGYSGRSILLVVFLILVVQASDVLQYLWGKLAGRHKVAPILSPAKTWEGLVGGLGSATLLGVALHPFTPFTPLQAGAFALLVTLLGFLGGLVLSAVKRDLGVKDWGLLLDGHGGVLDRVDSLCFSAPIFFHLTRYFFVP